MTAGVTIVGAGVGGLATACALAARGAAATVVERRGDLLEGGRAILLQPNGLAALDRIGALAPVAERGRQIGRVVFRDTDQRSLATLDYAELRGHPHPYAIEIRPPALRLALAQRLAELGGEPPRLGSELVSLARDGAAVVGIRYRDCAGAVHELDAACLVGADGPDSSVREQLGVAVRRLGAADSYVLGTVDTAADVDALEVHCGPGYGNGVVPLADGTYFWDRVTADNRSAVEARDLHGWRRVYERRLPRGSPIPAAIRSWEQLTVVRVRPFWAGRPSRGGAVLVGDAAGAVHPQSAQGANLALEDASALADALADALPDGRPAPGLLARYVRERTLRRRRFVVQSLLTARVIDAPTQLWQIARRSNLAALRLAPARRIQLRLGSS